MAYIEDTSTARKAKEPPTPVRASVYDAAMKLGLVGHNQMSWMFDEPPPLPPLPSIPAPGRPRRAAAAAAPPQPKAAKRTPKSDEKKEPTKDLATHTVVLGDMLAEADLESMSADSSTLGDTVRSEESEDSDTAFAAKRVSRRSRRNSWLQEQAKRVEEELSRLEEADRALSVARQASRKARPVAPSFKRAHRLSRSETNMGGARRLPDLPVPKNPAHRAMLTQTAKGTPVPPPLHIDAEKSNAPFITITAEATPEEEYGVDPYSPSSWRNDVLRSYDIDLSSLPASPQSSRFSNSIGLSSPASTSSDSHHTSSPFTSPAAPPGLLPHPHSAHAPQPVATLEIKPLALKAKASRQVAPEPLEPKPSQPRSLSPTPLPQRLHLERSSSTVSRPSTTSQSVVYRPTTPHSMSPRELNYDRPPPSASLPTPPLPPEATPRTWYPPPLTPFSSSFLSPHTSPASSHPPSPLLRSPSLQTPSRSPLSSRFSTDQVTQSAPGSPLMQLTNLRSRLSIKRMKAKILSATGRSEKTPSDDGHSQKSPPESLNGLPTLVLKELPPLPAELTLDSAVASQPSMSLSAPLTKGRRRSATLPENSQPPLLSSANPPVPSAPALMQRGRHAPFPIHPIRKRSPVL